MQTSAFALRGTNAEAGTKQKQNENTKQQRHAKCLIFAAQQHKTSFHEEN